MLLQSATNPENGTVSYTYNADGTVATKTDAKGTTLTYVYDSMARLIQVKNGAVVLRSLTYDDNSGYGQNLNGRLARVDYETGLYINWFVQICYGTRDQRWAKLQKEWIESCGNVLPTGRKSDAPFYRWVPDCMSSPGCSQVRNKMIKKNSIAIQVSNTMLEVSGQLNNSAKLVKAECTNKEFERYQMAVARIMGQIWIEVFDPLSKKHPDLKSQDF